MRPQKQIPLKKDILSLETLIKRGCTQAQMAEYYGVDQSTISRRLKQLNDGSALDSEGSQY